MCVIFVTDCSARKLQLDDFPEICSDVLNLKSLLDRCIECFEVKTDQREKYVRIIQVFLPNKREMYIWKIYTLSGRGWWQIVFSTDKPNAYLKTNFCLA